MNTQNRAANQPLIDILPNVRGSYRQAVRLDKINWFNVGGEAEVVFRPADVEDLSHFLKHKPGGVPVTVLGVGSNLLVRDGGIDGVVIRLGRGFVDIRCEAETIEAGAGALSFNVAMTAAENGIGGLEFLSGIPGTVGGAVFMNAGAYGGDVSGVLVEAEAVDEKGDIHHLSVDDMGYVYRGNTLPDNVIVTKARLKGVKGDPKELKQNIATIASERESTQPIRSRTSGSTFKNPVGKKAWQLIDEAGCRGLTMGGAQVSEKHCNFFINTGNATAADIEMLGEEVRKRVLDKTGVELEWEIKRIGKMKE